MALGAFLTELSAWSWWFLRDAPFRPREETLTETLLTMMSRGASGSVWVQKATVPEEAAWGLDWAWAINTQAGWFVSLVQAKNIDGERWGVYPGLRDIDSGEQARRLIHFASLAQAVPLYAFYNSEVPPFGGTGASVSFGACGRSTLERNAGRPPWHAGESPMGVSVAHAQDVLAMAIPAPAKNQRAAGILSYSMPWECLLCPQWVHPIAASADDGILVRHVARQLGSHRATGEPDNARLERRRPGWLHESIPNWAAMVQEGGRVSADDEVPPARFLVVVDVEDELEA